ncbi:MAG: sigma-70 family RNA polymerase sigma factor [Thermoanaerobaculia bacterium]
MSWMEGNDLDLVERARAGDSDAFRELVDRHSRTMFKTAYRLTGNEADADDLVQEAFLRAYRKLDRFDGRSQFSTWLYRITVNCGMDLMRKKSRRSARAAMDEEVVLDTVATNDPRPDRLALSGEIGRAVESVLRTLSPMERAAFVLRHFEGRSIAEIGGLLGARSGATKHAVFRAVKKLRAALGPLVEESHEATQ